MGVLGERFGLPAVFVALGMVAAGAAALAFWLPRVVGAWSRQPVRAVASPLPDSGPGGR
jgi:hypothetical protein